MIKRIIAITLCLIMGMTGMVYAQTTTFENIEAPKLTVELKNYEDGKPYFLLKLDAPASVKKLSEEVGEDGALFYEVEYKVENGSWESAGGVKYAEESETVIVPENIGDDGSTDIKSNIYNFRVRLGLYLSKNADEYGNRASIGSIFSPFSNITSISIDAYQKPNKLNITKADIKAVEEAANTEQAAPVSYGGGSGRYDVFIRIFGIPGNSQADKHRGETNVISYSLDITSPVVPGSTLNTVMQNPGTFKFVRSADESSIKLFAAAGKGIHIRDAIVSVDEVNRQGINVIKMKLYDILISSFKQYTEDEKIMEEIVMSYSRIEYEYQVIQADGTLGTKLKETINK